MRFRHDTLEHACSKAVDHRLGPMACMRREGHEGKCAAMARDAGIADGVCFGCREPLGLGHRDDCYTFFSPLLDGVKH